MIRDSSTSSFLHPGDAAIDSSIAILHLRRDQLLPTVLHQDENGNSGYAEGVVTNTRFGSYPHSTLIGCKWGSQVLASQVDTGSRGRGKKRKSHDLPVTNGHDTTHKDKRMKNGHESIEEAKEGGAGASNDSLQPKAAVTAATGFCHVLPPTPESWTISLPHRTQVVYTPDYSYILQKLQARPGSVVIEAGAGSGSFTHASVRAVFNGYSASAASQSSGGHANQRQGRVYSYEYHEPRAKQLELEIKEHGLSSIVQVTHRDVYEHGFRVRALESSNGVSSETLASPRATQVFLDLPAPWQALPHLTRSPNGPLDPEQTTRICIFLPCIEQVQRAVTALRTHGWVEISMQELTQRRLEVRREHVGLDLQGLRGVNAVPASVDEAIERLLEVEKNGRRYQNAMSSNATTSKAANSSNGASNGAPHQSNKANRLVRNAEEAASRKMFKEGRLVHRTEPEIRTHTSYLIFAVLPREWTREDEEKCRQRWPAERITGSQKSKK